MDQAVRIAQMKIPGSYSKTLKSAVKEVIGTCVSMGVTVEGKEPKDVIGEIDKGVHDQLFKEEKHD